MRRQGTWVIGLVALATDAASGQQVSTGRLTVWHGGAKADEVHSEWSLAGMSPSRTNTRAPRVVSVGDSVCVVVRNAHPVLYSYGVEVDTFSTTAALPSAPLLGLVAKFAGSGILPLEFKAQQDEKEPATDKLARRIANVAQAFAKARGIAAASDAPGEPWSANASFREAGANIFSALASFPEALDGESVRATLDRWFSEVPEGDRKSALGLALRAYATALASQIDAFRAQWSGPSSWQTCVVAGKDPVRVQLKASARDTSAAKQRKTGIIAELDIVPRFSEPVIRLLPVLTVNLSNGGSPDYQVRDGAVVNLGDSDQLIPQPAALLAFRALQWGHDGSFVLRMGVGTNVTTANSSVDRLFGAFTIGYREALTVGLGIGRVRRPVLTDPSLLGKPVPAGKELKDFLGAPENRPATFLTFSLASLDALPVLGSLTKK